MSDNVTLRKALKIVRKMGFSTTKDRGNGSWYISKPYYHASALSFTNGLVTHVWLSNGQRIDWRQFITDMESVPF